jgi:hypothetical protein
VGAVVIGDTGVEEMSDGEILTWCRAKCQDYTPQEKTLRIWLAILRAFDAIGVPMTVRQMFYALVARAIIEKTEQGYEQVGYHLLNMRRQRVVPYGFIRITPDTCGSPAAMPRRKSSCSRVSISTGNLSGRPCRIAWKSGSKRMRWPTLVIIFVTSMAG